MPPIQPFVIQTTEKVWGTETLVAHGPGYTGKVLVYKAGHQGGLQLHVEKDETFYLHEGRAIVVFDLNGELVRVPMVPGMSYHVPAGAVHQFKALTDCIVFEASNPGFNDRVNVGERYGVDGEAR